MATNSISGGLCHESLSWRSTKYIRQGRSRLNAPSTHAFETTGNWSVESFKDPKGSPQRRSFDHCAQLHVWIPVFWLRIYTTPPNSPVPEPSGPEFDIACANVIILKFGAAARTNGEVHRRFGEPIVTAYGTDVHIDLAYCRQFHSKYCKLVRLWCGRGRKIIYVET